MLSLRSLAFILCSAIRRARALSCAALHCFPDINGRKRRKIATNNATKMATAAPMCSLLRTVYASQGDHGSGRKGPFPTQPICRDRVTLTRFSVPLIPNTRVCRRLIRA
jgi:hypothetical protein